MGSEVRFFFEEMQDGNQADAGILLCADRGEIDDLFGPRAIERGGDGFDDLLWFGRSGEGAKYGGSMAKTAVAPRNAVQSAEASL